MEMATCSPPIAPALAADFPEVVQWTRACAHPAAEQQLLRVGNRSFYQPSGFYADSTFFEVLDYHFVEGDPSTVLDEPFSLVISQQLAQKLFGLW